MSTTNLSALLDARDVCADLSIKLAKLRAMAERGEFPELLHVTRGEYRVRRTDYEAWQAGRWTRAEMARSELEWHRMQRELQKEA